MTWHPTLAALSLAAAGLLAAPAQAAGDHGHDHGAAAPAAAGPALPRFAAVSETFELVGVLQGKQLTLYLDRSADNSPVRDAQIELEMAGAKFKAQKHGDEEYEVVLAEVPKPGVTAITATVTAGTETDLLAGELDLPEDVAAAGPAWGHRWTTYAGWAGAALGALLLLGGFLRLLKRRAAASRLARTGGAA